MSIVSESAISCPSCHREWQDHPGVIPTCKLARDLATTLRAVLHYAQPPEYTRDISAQEVYFDLLENARRLVVKARTFESDLTTEDTEDTERQNDLQCELAAWELLREAESRLAQAREALREIWQSGDAFLPHVDQETTSRWRKAAGWEEAK